MTDLKARIATEIYRAIERLGGDGELLSIVGSHGDSLDDEDVLALLRDWNKRHAVPLAPVSQGR